MPRGQAAKPCANYGSGFRRHSVAWMASIIEATVVIATVTTRVCWHWHIVMCRPSFEQLRLDYIQAWAFCKALGWLRPGPSSSHGSLPKVEKHVQQSVEESYSRKWPPHWYSLSLKIILMCINKERLPVNLNFIETWGQEHDLISLILIKVLIIKEYKSDPTQTHPNCLKSQGEPHQVHLPLNN